MTALNFEPADASWLLTFSTAVVTSEPVVESSVMATPFTENSYLPDAPLTSAAPPVRKFAMLPVVVISLSMRDSEAKAANTLAAIMPVSSTA